MLYGVVDIGSNTVRLTVYEVDPASGAFSIFFKLKTMVGLAGYIEKKSGRLAPEGEKRLVEVLNDYIACCGRFKGLKGPYAFATAGIRNAKNAKTVIERVQKACGIAIELVSGVDEAFLGYAGAMRQSSLSRGVQLDVGGGSTEIGVFERRRLLRSQSLPLGSLSLFDSYVHGLLPTPAEVDRIQEAVRGCMSGEEGFEGFTAPIASGVGGTARAALRLRNAWYPDERGPRANVTRDQVRLLLERVFYDPHASARDILRVAPERIHTCMPGLAVIDTVLETFCVDELEVHDFGVREGYLLDRVLQCSA